ncbi:type II toxin-antitoxin system VapB family antitoxin [Rhizobium sp. P32RR-XVIII]|uniref:type II toxin-antitoxin system VapB family antitoxin n=1 Tax=Rhizobium sp. P32RR-XVIII TaxID=2726738 RepID=UPI0014564878|nr:type II toxin-antitoxin system VapB family antitoxin [Rhizobium sp. P32RR-XVIII]NLS07193.1 type II toxin-antitoxin system VapB family antitoxin [Rhizobium sp. P32RR-XVIII]
MSKPQLSILRAKARDLAHALARRTGMPVNKLEQALEHHDSELRQQKNRHPIDAVWDLAADDRKGTAAGVSSVHDEFYDEHGLTALIAIDP